MAHPKKISMPIAINHYSDQDLSCQHVTTADFMQYNVTKAMEIVPKQTISFNSHECFARLDPLPVPTFGRANIVHRAFFVPMRTIYPAWNDFITDTIHQYTDNDLRAVPTDVPYVYNKTLSDIFVDSEFSTVVEGATDSEKLLACDFIRTNYSTNNPNTLSSTSYRRFTKLGKWAYKLFRSLGMTICWQDNNLEPVSIMPLLAVIRIYYDYYYPSQYLNDQDSAKLHELVTRDSSQSHQTYFSSSRLIAALKIMYNLPYANDYFVSAWDNPAGPTTGHSSDITINDMTVGDSGNEFTSIKTLGTQLSSYGTNTPVIEARSLNGNISQFAINALKSLSDYMRRHQIVGSRSLDRYLSRFGIQLSDEKLNRAYLLTEYSQELQFGDVFSTADTEGATLGDYAGKGVSYGNGQFSFTADEYGYIIITTTIVPVVQYFQGRHRMCSHISKLDFFTPEFDGLGTQAIAATELFCPTTVQGAIPSTYKDKVFGFVPRYAEYKIPYSQLTGDLSLNSYKSSSDSWTLYRDMQPFFENVADSDVAKIQHGINFVKASDAEQYNRIFGIDAGADHFKIINNFNIQSHFPARSLYDDYEFKDYDKSEHVSVEIGGKSL